VRATGGVWFETTGAGITVDGQPVLTGTNVSRLVRALSQARSPDGTIIDADISPAAAIADTKLAAISTGGKVANSATTATSATVQMRLLRAMLRENFSAARLPQTAFQETAADLPLERQLSGFGHNPRFATGIQHCAHKSVWLLGSSSPAHSHWARQTAALGTKR